MNAPRGGSTGGILRSAAKTKVRDNHHLDEYRTVRFPKQINATFPATRLTEPARSPKRRQIKRPETDRALQQVGVTSWPALSL